MLSEKEEDAVKCLAFGDRVIKLNDYLLEQESINAISKQDYRSKSFIALKEAREI